MVLITSGVNMIINSISLGQNFLDCPHSKYSSSTSFTSVHPAVYFVKGSDGKFHQVFSADIIKTLQRKMVGWLNKPYNDSVAIKKGKKPKISKVESPEDKSIRDRLVRFFYNNDPDYAKRPLVRSFYTKNNNGKIYSFILSGQSSELVEAAAKPIGQARGVIKAKKDNITKNFGIDAHRAKNYVPKEDVRELAEASKNYHEDAVKVIKTLLSQNRLRDMRFEAYFVPYMKGKEVKYQLTDAYLKREVRL